MRFHSICIVALLGLSPLTVNAQTFTWLQDIPLGGVEGLVSGVTSVNGDAYVAGFGNRRVVKVAGFNTATPAATQHFATDVTENATDGIAWPVNTGLVTIDYRATDQLLMVAGDTFGLGDGIIFQIDAITGTIVRKQGANADGGGPARVAGAAFYGPSNVIAQFQSGTNYWHFNPTLTSAGFYSGPSPANSRDIAVDQTNGTAYISYNSGTTAGIHRIIDGGTAFESNGNSNEPDWYTTTMTAAGGTIQGIGLGTIGSTQYAFLALRDDADIKIVPTTATAVPVNSAAVLTLDVAQLYRPADVTLATVGSSQYLLVTQNGVGGNNLSVFGVNGATLSSDVQDWLLY